jgi:hypothetical protein
MVRSLKEHNLFPGKTFNYASVYHELPVLMEFSPVFYLLIKVDISTWPICCADRVLPGRIPGRMRSSPNYFGERTLRISGRISGNGRRTYDRGKKQRHAKDRDENTHPFPDGWKRHGVQEMLRGLPARIMRHRFKAGKPDQEIGQGKTRTRWLCAYYVWPGSRR